MKWKVATTLFASCLPIYDDVCREKKMTMVVKRVNVEETRRGMIRQEPWKKTVVTILSASYLLIGDDDQDFWKQQHL